MINILVPMAFIAVFEFVVCFYIWKYSRRKSRRKYPSADPHELDRLLEVDKGDWARN